MTVSQPAGLLVYRRNVVHRAMMISEVFGLIVDCLSEDTVLRSSFSTKDIDKASRGALAVLARTCRAFSEPALDALWRRLHSLRPFVLCLPTKAWYDDTMGTLPAFDEREWDVLLRYTPRVKELTLRYDNTSVEILQSLWFRTTLLLPNLRKLHWVHGDYVAFPSIRLLLSPSLVELHAWVKKGDHPSILAFLESYHTLCPNLKSLYLHYESNLPHVTAAISRAISRSPDLETLDCNDIDEAALVQVAQSRCLKEFTCSLHHYETDTLRLLAGYGTSNSPPFENLCILKLGVADLSSIVPYLRSKYQPFEEVSFNFHMVSTPGVFHEFFAALCSSTRCRSLRRITLSSPRFIGLVSSQPINFQVLSPLMTLSLHEFDINIQNPISLNDDEFVRLVQAWPKLRSLCLNQRSGWDFAASIQVPTLKGLLFLLTRCPKLVRLGLCVDARNIPLLSEDELLIRNTAITELSISNSPIEAPVTKVAHFLLQHFPSLIRVMVYPSITGHTHYLWTWRRVDREIKEIVGRRSPDPSEIDFI